MRIVIALTFIILIIWYIITRFEPSNGFVVLDEYTIGKMNKDVIIQKALWSIMILLQLFLSYKLYALMPTIVGIYRIGIQIKLVL